jgi:WD40 repeat protein
MDGSVAPAWRAVCCALIFIAVTPALAAYQPREARPVLAGKMHVAPLWSIAVDRAGQYVVSVSHDRTARVWSLADGKLVRVLHPPIGETFVDVKSGLVPISPKIHAVAISPDGRLVAVGGSSPPGMFTDPLGARGDEPDSKEWVIYLFERERGRLIKRIDGPVGRIASLAFSPDGQHLAASLRDGFRVFRLPGGEQLAAESENRSALVSLPSLVVAWLPDGGLVSVSVDLGGSSGLVSVVRRYDARFKRTATAKVPGGTLFTFLVAVSPDGSRLVVGYDFPSGVHVLATRDLSLLYSVDTQGINVLTTVSWAADGERLYAGGSNSLKGEVQIVCWEQAGRGKRSVLSTGHNELVGLHALPGGALVWGSRDPALGVLDGNGKVRWALGPEGGDYRDTKLLVNHDGSGVQFDLNVGREPHRFVLGQREVIAGPMDVQGFARPRVAALGLTVTDWKDQKEPKINGQLLSNMGLDRSHSLAISPRGDRFVLGMWLSLRLFGSNGNEIQRARTPGIAWAVNFTGDGRHVVAALGDGTIRWYGLPNLDERLALYLRRTDLAWVVWTPQGFFDAGKGGERLIGYLLNPGADPAGQRYRDADREAVLVRAEQLAEQFRRPDLVSQALTEQGHARVADAAYRLGDVRKVLAQGLPPEVEILSPGGEQTGHDYLLEFKVMDRGGGIGRIEYFVNGRLIEQAELRGELAQLPGQAPGTIRRPISLNQGENDIVVRVTNARNVWSDPESVKRIAFTPELKPTLWVLTVGITDYDEDSLKLKFPAYDSEEFEKTIRLTARKIYGERNIRVVPLRNKDATRERLRQAFRSIKDSIQPEDTFIVHLAGHGMTFEGRYHFLPVDAVHRNQQSLVNSSLGYEELRSLMANRATKSLVLLDTCDAGAFVQGESGIVKLQEVRAGGIKSAMEQLSGAVGAHVIGASASITQGGIKNHGVFTYALLNGLKGKAAERGVVTVGSLATYLDREVPDLSEKLLGYSQRPVQRLLGHLFPVGIPE